MDRSPGFGSTALSLGPIQTRPIWDSLSLRLPIFTWLNYEKHDNSPAHSSIGTRSHVNVLSRFVRKQFQVLFHWASRPSFRLSLTVLVHYRSFSVFSLGGWFPQIPTRYVPRGTWDTSNGLIGFAYKTFTLYGLTFQTVLLPHKLAH